MIDYFFVPENFGDHLLRSTITLLVILDPLGIVPIFIAKTQAKTLAWFRLPFPFSRDWAPSPP